MSRSRFAASLVACAVGMGTVSVALAGTSLKWEEIPKPVQETILSHGGKPANVDREEEKKDGKVLYEATFKDKDGVEKDFDITEDGKLVEIKNDSATDAAAERAERGKALLKDVKFSHPTELTNPFLPLSQLKKDVLEGSEDHKQKRIERTPRPDVRKTFTLAGQTVEAFAMEDREFENGVLEEVTVDYFVQDDKGTIYYLGEDVDDYKDGKIVGHDGSWMLGKDMQVSGVILPGALKVGQKFWSEDVSAAINEIDEVVSLSETVKVPAGTYHDCVKIKETLADGGIEYKYLAKGVGYVREVPVVGDELLISHETK